MGSFHRDYHEAHAVALELARKLRHSVGLEACSEYGKAGFRVALVPNLSSQRFGWESRCEVVEPGDPASEADLRIWARGDGPLAGYARNVLERPDLFAACTAASSQPAGDYADRWARELLEQSPKEEPR